MRIVGFPLILIGFIYTLALRILAIAKCKVYQSIRYRKEKKVVKDSLMEEFDKLKKAEPELRTPQEWRAAEKKAFEKDVREETIYNCRFIKEDGHRCKSTNIWPNPKEKAYGYCHGHAKKLGLYPEKEVVKIKETDGTVTSFDVNNWRRRYVPYMDLICSESRMSPVQREVYENYLKRHTTPMPYFSPNRSSRIE